MIQGRRDVESSRLVVVEIWGRQDLGSSRFGVIEFWGCQVLGLSSFGVVVSGSSSLGSSRFAGSHRLFRGSYPCLIFYPLDVPILGFPKFLFFAIWVLLLGNIIAA